MNRDELEQMEDEAVKEAHLELVSDHDRYQYEIKDLIRKKFAEKIAAVEREACAKVCEEYQDAVDRHRWPNGYECADAIRARGQE